jgi:hypothetical protein
MFYVGGWGFGYNTENSGVENIPNPLPGIEPCAFSHFVKA